MCGMFDDNGGADGGWPLYAFEKPKEEPKQETPCKCSCHQHRRVLHARPCCNNVNKPHKPLFAKEQ